MGRRHPPQSPTNPNVFEMEPKASNKATSALLSPLTPRSQASVDDFLSKAYPGCYPETDQPRTYSPVIDALVVPSAPVPEPQGFLARLFLAATKKLSPENTPKPSP